MAVKKEYAYAVVEVFKDNQVRVKSTRSHSRMMKAVKAAIKRKNHYTVLREVVGCTTI